MEEVFVNPHRDEGEMSADANHENQLAAVRLAEPIALTSIFPYAWQLIKRFGVGEEKHASLYSGLLISAFSLAEALTGMFWGALSDKVGRKPILICGCVGTVVSLLVIGFAQSFWVALAGRAIGGILNGNVAVIQTVVGELVTKSDHQPRVYSVMPFVWSLGSIIGPAIGGTFADPSSSYPHLFSPRGYFAQFPYLLPNLICAAILLISIVMSCLFLEETHPPPQSLWDCLISVRASEETPLPETTRLRKDSVAPPHFKVYGTCKAPEDGCFQSRQKVSDQLGILNKRIVGLIIAFGIFSYHTITYDQLLPIYLEDQPNNVSRVALTGMKRLQSSGGLGLTVQRVGLIMSIDGILALVVQAGIFPYAVAYLGIHRIFLIATVLHPLTFLLMPFLRCLPLEWLNVGILFCLSIKNLFSIIAFSALLILIREATPSSSVLGRVNGLAASVGSASRTIAPPIAGYLYSLGSRLNFVGLVWYSTALVAQIGAIQAFNIRISGPCSDVEDWNEEVLTLVNPSLDPSDDESNQPISVGSDHDLETASENSSVS